jgi:hypothetical protein
MIIIDNIPVEYQQQLHDTLYSPDFPWFLNKRTVKVDDPLLELATFLNDKTKDSQQFTHTFYKDDMVKSNYYPLISEILTHIERMGYEIKSINRIKANLMTIESDFPEDFYNTPHSDTYGSETMSLLYYVNDSDGDTFFFNEFFKEVGEHNFTELTINKRITPKMGNAVFFDSKQYHASSPPRFNNVRMVINFIFEVYKSDE